MSLSASQQRALDRIEDTLKRREPRLASMFAMFTRLTSNEALPWRESLEAAPWWSPRRRAASGRHAYGPIARVRAALLLSLATVVVVTAVLVGMTQSWPNCAGSMTARGPLISMSQPTHTHCPSASQAKGIGHGP